MSMHVSTNVETKDIAITPLYSCISRQNRQKPIFKKTGPIYALFIPKGRNHGYRPQEMANYNKFVNYVLLTQFRFFYTSDSQDVVNGTDLFILASPL